MIVKSSGEPEDAFLQYIARLLFILGVRRAFAKKGRQQLVAECFSRKNIIWVETETDAAAVSLARQNHLSGEMSILILDGDCPYFDGLIHQCLCERLPLMILDLLRPAVLADEARRGIQPKGTFEIRPDNVSVALGKAFALAMAEPMGAVHVRLGIDVDLKTSVPIERTRPVKVIVPTVRKQDPAVGEICKMLRKAVRPLILFGSEGNRAKAGCHVLDLARVLDAPILTTPSAEKGLQRSTATLIVSLGHSTEVDEVIKALVVHADMLVLIGIDGHEVREWDKLFSDHHTSIALSSFVSSDNFSHIDLLFLAHVGQCVFR